MERPQIGEEDSLANIEARREYTEPAVAESHMKWSSSLRGVQTATNC
jgi:hypothetical protein